MNASFKSKLRTHRRKLLHAIGDEKKDEVQDLLRSLVSLYERVNALLGPANSAPQEEQSLPNPEEGSA